jgi:hypothetical protein
MPKPKSKLRADHPFHGLPVEARETLLRLFSVVAANRLELSAEMLDEIEAISVEGVDPKWQIEQMRSILDRWATRH